MAAPSRRAAVPPSIEGDWRPISTAPKGVRILLYSPTLHDPVQFGAYNTYDTLRNGVSTFRSEGWVFDSHIVVASKDNQPTHWAPEPKGPRKAEPNSQAAKAETRRETIGERVAARRKALDLSQAELAARVTAGGFKISQQGIAMIEARGDTRPQCLIELAGALDVSPQWLRSGRAGR